MKPLFKLGRLLITFPCVFAMTMVFSTHSFGATFCVSNATELQDALATAASNGEDDVINIHQGIYVGNFVYASAEEFSINLHGGFTNGFTSQIMDARNTILDGNGLDHVFALSCQCSANIAASGITFDNGISRTMDYGGGLYIKTKGYINLTNNILSNNLATLGGGGLYLSGRGSTLINNSFTNNSAKGSGEITGGGALIYGSSKLINNAFTENKAYSTLTDAVGGGLYLSGTTNVLKANAFKKNAASAKYSCGSGGGAYIGGDSVYSPHNTIEQNEFVENSAAGRHGDAYGGGLYIVPFHVTNILIDNIFLGNSVEADYGYKSMGGGLYGGGELNRNTFTGNYVSGKTAFGGGVYCLDSTITNNIIAGNAVVGSEMGSGGGVYMSGGTFINNTIYGNAASTQGGGFFGLFDDKEATAQIFNNIVWSNTAPEASDLYMDNRQSDDPFFSVAVQLFANVFNQSDSGMCIEIPFIIDPSNLDENPLFRGIDDYHLMPNSSCIDTGNNDAPNIPDTDRDGFSRVLNGTVDIGAYEYVGSVTSPPDSPMLTVTTNGITVGCDWSPVPHADGYTLFYAPSPYTGPDSISAIDMGAKTFLSAALWKGAAYFVAVQAYNAYGSSGYSNIELFEIRKDTDLPPNPTGFCICETGSQTEFNALDVSLCWDPSTQPGVTDYKVQVIDTDTGTLVRTQEAIRNCMWSYSLAENKYDHGGTAIDRLTFRLWAVDPYGKNSGGYCEISVTNSQPATPKGLRTESWMYGVEFWWDSNPEPDIDFYRYRIQVESEAWSEWYESPSIFFAFFLTDDQRTSYPDGALVTIQVYAVDTWGNQSAGYAEATGRCDTLS